MFHRLLNLSKSNSFLLFGARGTGKSTLLKSSLDPKKSLYIDLLQPEEEDRLSRNPGELTAQLKALPPGQIEWVIIDEIQKQPKLLDIVHSQIENSPLKFAMTGSSARKLKRGAANLLAGRAFVYSLFPLTYLELGSEFDLQMTLQWGTLPKIFQYEEISDRMSFLRAYALTYLKEEIQSEQLVRHIPPFREFLEVAAQSNGQIINYTKIGRDVGADTKTVQTYFEILQDTLLGTLLLPFHQSIRKRQSQKPKFYFFDLGVKRALDRTLTQELLPQTFAYGKAFEHFVINECMKLHAYSPKDFQFSYLRTKDDAEIDLIIERPGLPDALVEIKSSQQVSEQDTGTLERLKKDFKNATAYCVSQDPIPKKIGGVHALPWFDAFTELGLTSHSNNRGKK